MLTEQTNGRVSIFGNIPHSTWKIPDFSFYKPKTVIISSKFQNSERFRHASNIDIGILFWWLLGMDTNDYRFYLCDFKYMFFYITGIENSYVVKKNCFKRHNKNEIFFPRYLCSNYQIEQRCHFIWILESRNFKCSMLRKDKTIKFRAVGNVYYFFINST